MKNITSKISLIFTLAAIMTIFQAVLAPVVEAKDTVNSVTSNQSYQIAPLSDTKSYNDFVVGPGKLELILNPGDTRTIQISVANRLGTDKTFRLSEEDFIGSSDLNQPVVLLGDDKGPYSLKNVISIPSSLVNIPQGNKALIPVTISIPKNAQPGGMYGSVLVSVASNSTGATSTGESTTATNPVITRLAVLFFVRVAGDAKTDGQLTKFALAGNKNVVWDNDLITFDLVFQNKGNVHLVPSGTIAVTNMIGASVGSVVVDPWFAMPDSNRFREISWNTPFLFGKYTAHASINRGYGSTTDEMTISFWVIPWKVILMIFVVLFVLLVLVRSAISRFKIVRK